MFILYGDKQYLIRIAIGRLTVYENAFSLSFLIQDGYSGFVRLKLLPVMVEESFLGGKVIRAGEEEYNLICFSIIIQIICYIHV